MINLKISQRLKEISDFIPEGSEIIDIGADHGLLDIYLNKYKNCNCLATDISENCIETAKKNINKYKAKVQTLVTDGLNGINLKDEIIIISGMGTNNIKKILNKNINNDLVISSHTNISDLKEFLIDKNYIVYKEKIITEKKQYHIIYFKQKTTA